MAKKYVETYCSSNTVARDPGERVQNQQRRSFMIKHTIYLLQCNDGFTESSNEREKKAIRLICKRVT